MRLQTSLHPDRQTYLEYVSALDLYHRSEEIQEELVALHTRASDTTRSLSSDTQQGDVSNEEKAQRNGELLGRTPTTNHRTDSQDRKDQGQRSPKVGGSKERRCPQSATGICLSCSCCSPSLLQHHSCQHSPRVKASLSGQQDQAGSPQVRREPPPLVSVLGRL